MKVSCDYRSSGSLNYLSRQLLANAEAVCFFLKLFHDEFPGEDYLRRTPAMAAISPRQLAKLKQRARENKRGLETRELIRY